MLLGERSHRASRLAVSTTNTIALSSGGESSIACLHYLVLVSVTGSLLSSKDAHAVQLAQATREFLCGTYRHTTTQRRCLRARVDLCQKHSCTVCGRLAVFTMDRTTAFRQVNFKRKGTDIKQRVREVWMCHPPLHKHISLCVPTPRVATQLIVHSPSSDEVQPL